MDVLNLTCNSRQSRAQYYQIHDIFPTIKEPEGPLVIGYTQLKYVIPIVSRLRDDSGMIARGHLITICIQLRTVLVA